MLLYRNIYSSLLFNVLDCYLGMRILFIICLGVFRGFYDCRRCLGLVRDHRILLHLLIIMLIFMIYLISPNQY